MVRIPARRWRALWLWPASICGAPNGTPTGWHPRLRQVLALWWMLHGALFVATSANASVVLDCDRAAHQAAAATGVPVSVLRTITRTETGRNKGGILEPWPWTVNMEGEGHWFDSEDAARAYVVTALRRGARSFDVGCFQINYKWHGGSFLSIDQMFDPLENALYAARFLRELHAELGDWPKAAGAYHSRTPDLAHKYRARFDRILADLEVVVPPVSRELGVSRSLAKLARSENSFPLLQAVGRHGTNGSLVRLRDPSGQGAIVDRVALIGW